MSDNKEKKNGIFSTSIGTIMKNTAYIVGGAVLTIGAGVLAYNGSVKLKDVYDTNKDTIFDMFKTKEA